ncbi:MAG: lysine--tRNA ligase [Rhizobiales bacterium]|nr:lysine--tRNA ligase [Hyphomicrobiales bacterium]
MANDVTKAQREAAEQCKAWPFEEARRLRDRVERPGRGGRPVLFETGYGPSGLPHIGTFGEVARTTMVRHAFEVLTGGAHETHLLCVSDDMDGLRKVPDNVPNPQALVPHLQRPLTQVPDPFGTHESYGAHMNARLRAFLDHFGFRYEFASATQLYRSGRFDEMLLRALERYDEIMAVMLPTLGEERRRTYSPFLPISPTTGRVLYVPMKAIDPGKGTITFADEDGTDVTLEVTGGRTKLQWKPDFGMRWAALGVDFEMFGKDHQTNAPIYSAITRILGAEPPVQYVYELFLDEKGEKISKSIGNGITVDEWLRFASPESLALFMFQKPRVAKRLYIDVIPRAVDEYFQHVAAFPGQDEGARLANPTWHIHSGPPPAATTPVSFNLLLNLVGAANANDKDVLWGFIRRYAPGASPESEPHLDALAGYAIAYYAERIRPKKRHRAPTDLERTALADLEARLADAPVNADAETYQNLVYEVGKAHPFANLRDWFGALYEVLLGAEQGPRFGSFIALYGRDETRRLITEALSGALLPTGKDDGAASSA